ncbi:MAG: ABC transporter ATP-binding protein [Thermoanaerobaculia bacterium]|nr:ABC transporter ATP-binding protein [Thermoanaerobaculia bacterium]
MIEARGLTRRFGDLTAVRDVSFQVEDGEILGLLGPNGAGKTTTLRMLTGFLPPTDGSVTIAGHDLLDEPAVARRELGYLPENVALYPEMRVAEYLAFRARLARLPGRERQPAIDRAISGCLLGEVKDQIIGTLSKGYRQRVGLAAAILHGPKVLILDEPTVGLDPKQIISIRELIRDLGRERTLILSTHILPEVEQLCQRVLIIDRGRVIAEGTPAELQGHSDLSPELVVTLVASDGTGADAIEALTALEGMQHVSADGSVTGRFRARHVRDADPRESVFRLAVERGWTLLEMSQRRPSLEELFVQLTTAQGEPTEPAGALSQGSSEGVASETEPSDEVEPTDDVEPANAEKGEDPQ